MKSRIHNDETTRTRMLLQKLAIEQSMQKKASAAQLTVTITREQYLKMLDLSIEALQSRLIKRVRL